MRAFAVERHLSRVYGGKVIAWIRIQGANLLENALGQDSPEYIVECPTKRRKACDDDAHGVFADTERGCGDGVVHAIGFYFQQQPPKLVHAGNG